MRVLAAIGAAVVGLVADHDRPSPFASSATRFR